MSDKRFRWSSAKLTQLEGALELKSKNVRKTLIKDNDLRCWVKACRRPFKKGDVVLYPNKSVNTSTNEILAHASCIDAYCAEHAAKSASAARLQDAERKGLLPLAAASAASVKAKNKLSGLNEALAEQLERLRAQYYRAGYEACLADLARLGESEDQSSDFRH